MENGIERFKKAHEDNFEVALKEIKNGRKVSHWMWYVFPQLDGLGYSEIAMYYAIKNIDEARDYINDEELSLHMKQICDVLLELDETDPFEIFGYPDALKLHSCATLFSIVKPELGYFQEILDKFFDGKKDEGTVKIIRNHDGMKGWM